MKLGGQISHFPIAKQRIGDIYTLVTLSFCCRGMWKKKKRSLVSVIPQQPVMSYHATAFKLVVFAKDI